MHSQNARSITLAYNARATREGWPAICDPDLDFRTPALARMFALWREKAAGRPIPARSDFSLRCLKEFLRDIAIYERITGSDGNKRYRVRLMGSTFAETMGDLTGKFLEDVIPQQFLPRWYAALDASLDASAPLRFVSRTDTVGKSFLVAEYFEAPLLGDGGEANLVLAGSHFSATHSWPQTLAAERAKVAALKAS